MSEPNRLDELVGGKYRIVRFLASGGMGSVYEAQHAVVRRRFAVKFLHQELALRRELLSRFQREAEAAGALESEHVAAAVDFGIATDGAPYIVLEYLVGESLQCLLEREGNLPVERATNLVQQAARGVQAAHAAGIVHRDLKPHNLFVCRREDGTDLVKVLDFGVAKLEFLETSDAATHTGSVLGTPSYMSPEQARGERNVDHLSDVHALGAILYELLSGRKPHPGASHNAILHHIATQPPLPLALGRPGLPDALVAVVEGALSGNPAERPASAEAFALAVAPWAHAEVWPAPKLEPSAPRHAEPSTTLPAPFEPPSAPPVSVAMQSAELARVGDDVAPASGTPESHLLAVPSEPPGRALARSERSGRLGLAALILAVLVMSVLFFAFAHGDRKAEVQAVSVAALASPVATVVPADVRTAERALTTTDTKQTVQPVVNEPAPTPSERALRSASSVAPSERPAGRPRPPSGPAQPSRKENAPAPVAGFEPNLVPFNPYVRK